MCAASVSLTPTRDERSRLLITALLALSILLNPIVGSVVAGFLGSFLGATLVTYQELGDIGAAPQVGWGVLLARVFGVALKVGVAVAVLVLGGVAWVVPRGSAFR